MSNKKFIIVQVLVALSLGAPLHASSECEKLFRNLSSYGSWKSELRFAQSKWHINFTNPSEHLPNNFLYLVHGVNRRRSLSDAFTHITSSRPSSEGIYLLSTTLISSVNPSIVPVTEPSGLILEPDPAAVIAAGHGDLMVANNLRIDPGETLVEFDSRVDNYEKQLFDKFGIKSPEELILHKPTIRTDKGEWPTEDYNEVVVKTVDPRTLRVTGIYIWTRRVRSPFEPEVAARAYKEAKELAAKLKIPLIVF